MKLSDILNIQPGVTALIGGGGKTSMLLRLADELSARGTVIVCTSAKILAPADLPIMTTESPEAIASALRSSPILCLGTRLADEKLSAPPISFDRIKKLVDYVLVEADGAHRLPIKAHAPYEPVIPGCTDKTILVIGADAFGQPIRDICHRTELFASLADADPSTPVTPAIISRVIAAERLGDCLFINKVESEAAAADARSLAALLTIPVYAGSIMKEEYRCLH